MSVRCKTEKPSHDTKVVRISRIFQSASHADVVTGDN